VKQITTNLTKNGYRFSTLIDGIVDSVPFQMGRGEGVTTTMAKSIEGSRK
jgi:hypothetical protein